jgi:hypothetical protein
MSMRREKIRLAYLYASPLVYRQNGASVPIDILDTSSEQALLREALTESNRNIALRTEVATSDNLRKLVTLGCRALHYTGHGMPGCLAFENGKGEMHSLEVGVMQKLFAAGGGAEGVQFVFVSACHSQSAGAAFVQAGVPHVVAVRWDAKVSDKSSRIFAKNFYLALLVGRTVKQAFEIGQAAVEAAPDAFKRGDDCNPKFLLLPDGGNHDVRVFHDAEDGPHLDETPPLPTNTCDTALAYFPGRNTEMQELVSVIHSAKRCVTIRGEPGIGKTALATKACHYINERRLFEAIYFIPVAKIPFARSDVHPVCQAIAHATGVGEIREENDLFKVLNTRHVMIVLDGCEGQVQHGPGFVRFLSALFKRTRQVSILITSVHAIQAGGSEFVASEAEKVISLGRLDDINSAALFTHLAPRQLSIVEMGASCQGDAIQSLANTELLRVLRGHPRAITMLVPFTQDIKLDQAEIVDKAVMIMQKAVVPSSVMESENFHFEKEQPPSSWGKQNTNDLMQVQDNHLESVKSCILDEDGVKLWMSLCWRPTGLCEVCI